MKIRFAKTEDDITACYPVMSQLRSHITEKDFISRIYQQSQHSGYQIAMAENDGDIVSLAGFRISDNLAWGRFLYVDDLVTAEQHRGKGYGKQLLSWLREHALANGCRQLHLDSGLPREDAHRFYIREGMTKAGYHFVENLT
ncbi:MAG: GNAT family N-acetyltransferase [Pseudomonadota bacterium]